MSNGTPQKQGRGCLFYGCLTCLVLLLIAGLAVFFTVRWAKNQRDAYTDTAPMKLKKVEVSDEEFKTLKERVQSFSDALKDGKAAEPLVLTERDINAYIAKEQVWKDKVYVSLNGDEIKGQVSLPLTDLGWIGRGRYLNGEATIKASMENGEVIVKITDLRVKGKPLPDWLGKSFLNENLAKDATQDPEAAEAIRKFESIQVENSQVTVKSKPPPPAPPVP